MVPCCFICKYKINRKKGDYFEEKKEKKPMDVKYTGNSIYPFYLVAGNRRIRHIYIQHAAKSHQNRANFYQKNNRS